MIISRLNPLIEALEKGRPLNKVWLADTVRGPKIERVKELCRSAGVVFQFVPASAIARKTGGCHQGVWAEMAPVRFYELEDLLAPAAGKPGLLLALDGVEDAGNLGAIVRTAAAADVNGIVMAARRAAPVNETTLSASAGALTQVKIARIPNLAMGLDRIKEAGFWVVGADGRAGQRYDEYDFRSPTAILMGGENRGISPALKKACDVLVRIPLAPSVESLNVAAASAVMLFEALRQRGKWQTVSY